MNRKKEILASVITDVSSGYGAPMGRRNVGERPTDGTKVYDYLVPFEDYCYDRGGAYWGGPANLRVACTEDLSYVEFYRAEK
jgi:hypothetical protein